MTKLTAEQRVQKTHIRLMNDPKYCLYSGIFMMGSTRVDDNPKLTACTNGRDTIYGRSFVDKLSDKELAGLILHENLHKAFRHMTTWDNLWKEDAELANMACDYVINLMIVDTDPRGDEVTLPKGGCYDQQYRGMDAGTVYRLLKQQKQGGKGNGQGNGSGNEDGEGGSGTGFDEHQWEEANELTPEEKQQLEHDIDQALRQGALLAGKMNGNVPREIGDVLKAKVDWREVLRDFITSFCSEKDYSTWRRPNRRWVDRDIYMPSMIGESAGRMVVAVDTSGSIGSAEIGQFLGELQLITQSVTPEGIDLLYWDSRVAQHEKYDKDSYDTLLTSTKPKGGGGTSPQCIVDYINKNRMKPECVIVLTDGYVDGWGTGWPCPVLWGITGRGVTAAVGVSVEIN